MAESEVAFERGDLEQAERILRDGLDLLERIGDRVLLPDRSPSCSRRCCSTGIASTRCRSCSTGHARRPEPTTSSTSSSLTCVEGAVLAHGGSYDEAEAASRRCSRSSPSTTDYVYARPVAHSYLRRDTRSRREARRGDGARDDAMEILARQGKRHARRTPPGATRSRRSRRGIGFRRAAARHARGSDIPRGGSRVARRAQPGPRGPSRHRGEESLEQEDLRRGLRGAHLAEGVRRRRRLVLRSRRSCSRSGRAPRRRPTSG